MSLFITLLIYWLFGNEQVSGLVPCSRLGSLFTGGTCPGLLAASCPQTWAVFLSSNLGGLPCAKKDFCFNLGQDGGISNIILVSSNDINSGMPWHSILHRDLPSHFCMSEMRLDFRLHEYGLLRISWMRFGC